MTSSLKMCPDELSHLQYIAGIDETGRGSFISSVVSCAIILKKEFSHPLINDSKKLSKKDRELLVPIIKQNALSVKVGIVDNNKIDKVNILYVTMESMHQALDKLEIEPDHILVDGNKFINYKNIPHTTVIKGDSIYLPIAAASIIAKVYRDKLIEKLSKEYPVYGWDKNAGYGTKQHRDAITRYGLTPYHRKSFIREELTTYITSLF